MDDEKLLKKIEEAVREVEIPDSLEPEEVRKRLEKEVKRKTASGSEIGKPGSKVIHFRKYVSWAAAAVVFLSALLIAGPAIKKQGGVAQDNSSLDANAEAQTALSPPATDIEEASEAENGNAEASEMQNESSQPSGPQDENAQVSEMQNENAQSSGGAEGDSQVSILHVNNYQELLTMVMEKPEPAGTFPQNEVIYDTGAAESGAPWASGITEEAASDQDGSMIMVENDISAPAQSHKEISTTTGTGKETDFSSTNIQEENVDEADIVKTDGTYIYALDSKGNIRIVEAGTMKLTAEISRPGGPGSETQEIYIDGDILQVIWTGYDFITHEEEVELPGMDSCITQVCETVSIQRTSVASYDISDRSNPVKIGLYNQDGAYLTSRKNGEYLYLFTSYMPQARAFIQEKDFYYYVPRSGAEYLPCERIYLPGRDRSADCSGRRYLVGGTVKNTKPDTAVDTIAVVSGAETFYVSQENIYAANSVWEDGEGGTDIVRLGYKDGRFEAGSYGRIPGTLNNNFSMNEYKGNLRIVTTNDYHKTAYMDGKAAGVETVQSNGLYILDRNLSIIGEIEHLAEGEHIESARFMGNTGYFVTYRNIDPLFSVDLSDPENPKILGELKITGFSEYLHFYGKDKLLGIGWETDPDTGNRKGLKCSMFDLSNPGNVKETDKLILSDADSCNAVDDYKAILIDPEKNIFGFAYADRNPEGPNAYFYGVFTYSSEDGFQVLGNIQVPEALAEGYDGYESLRGLYIGKLLYVTSSYGIQSYDMEDGFAEKASLTW